MTVSPTFRALLLIAGLSLVPVIPYALLGYAGQDLPFHVCSWLDLRDGWRAGHLNPGWSAEANYGLGDPHLTFYPPVSYFLGAVLTLILPLKLAPAIFAWLALVLGGVAMYIGSKEFVAHRDRFIAALLYMLGPYTITTSLIRYAAAELLVQAWLPLIVMYFYQAVWLPKSPGRDGRQKPRRALILLGLLLGLSWITNIPASIVLLYSLASAALGGSLSRRSVRPMLQFVAAEGLAAVIAAFHLVPVWLERPWIHPDTLLRIDPLQLLLFMPHYTFKDSPLLVVCWIFLCAEILLVAACLRRRTLLLAGDSAVPIWAALAAASLFLQSPLSIPLWQYGPELRFVQFPLRFLSVLGVALPLLLLSRGTRTTLRRPAYLMLALLSVMPFLGYLSEQAVPGNRKPPLKELLDSWHRQGAPEYLPYGTLMPVGAADMPGAAAVDRSNASLTDPACHVAMLDRQANQRIVTTASPVPCRLRLRIYYYPYWKARDESQQPIALSRDSTGLLLMDVPPGSHTVLLLFQAASPARTASAVFSLLALLLSLAALFAAQKDRSDSRISRAPL